MSTPAPSSLTAKVVTTDTKLARLFGLKGEGWLRHAKPISVWTRFAVLPLLAVSIWSRDWIGWWSLVPIVLSLVFMVVNPLLFPQAHLDQELGVQGGVRRAHLGRPHQGGAP